MNRRRFLGAAGAVAAGSLLGAELPVVSDAPAIEVDSSSGIRGVSGWRVASHDEFYTEVFYADKVRFGRLSCYAGTHAGPGLEIINNEYMRREDGQPLLPGSFYLDGNGIYQLYEETPPGGDYCGAWL